MIQVLFTRKHLKLWSLGFAFFALILILAPGQALNSYNGFPVESHDVPLSDILAGGPPRDGIPALLDPRFLEADQVTFLSEHDRVLGLVGTHEVKAYPIKILNWHEIVNDRLDQLPVMITYCPLCGTGMGFKRTIDDQVHTFGVSGLLYQSDVLMYDHQTESLWSQIAMKALTGSSMGKQLEPIFLEHTTWDAWRRAHPKSLVLSTQTGHTRDYQHDPYSEYRKTKQLMFPTGTEDSQFHPKEWVLGVEIKGRYKAYPFSEMTNIKPPIRDALNGQDFIVCWYPENKSAKAVDLSGVPLHSFMAYWFAWSAFHPETDVFTADRRQSTNTDRNLSGLC